MQGPALTGIPGTEIKPGFLPMKSFLNLSGNNMIDEFIHWAPAAGAYKLIQCSSGNLSQRLDNNTMLVSGTGSWLSTIRRGQISVVDMKDGKSTNGIRPTGELPMHLEIMRQRKEINTILHFQSEAATSLCCADYIPDYNVIIEVPLYVGKVATLPYLPPGSSELVQAVRHLPIDIRMVQLRNHGQIAMGSSLMEVIQMAVFFELACKVIINNADQVITLDNDQMEGLKTYAAGRK
ncbi:MAG TPA: class II aldolase family protein [Bacteroidales bacterium]|nr:class II aldolase family protein [Bacteroidales bacterium]